LNNASKYDPSSDPNIEGNPYKTLFVARLSYNITEQRLRKEFEEFGSVLKIRIIDNKLSGKPRGYAFIEYERLEDMKRAYKIGMNRKIEGRSIVVDVERGRTVADWRPRRLGENKVLWVGQLVN
jgi:U1 small nuclear ribonucleoprotein